MISRSGHVEQIWKVQCSDWSGQRAALGTVERFGADQTLGLGTKPNSKPSAPTMPTQERQLKVCRTFLQRSGYNPRTFNALLSIAKSREKPQKRPQTKCNCEQKSEITFVLQDACRRTRFSRSSEKTNSTQNPDTPLRSHMPSLLHNRLLPSLHCPVPDRAATRGMAAGLTAAEPGT